MDKFYKIVWSTGPGEYWSSAAWGKYRLPYKIGEKTKPFRGTKWVMAFNNKVAALRYADPGDEVVLECEGELADWPGRRVSTIAEDFYIRGFWRGDPVPSRGIDDEEVAFLAWCKPLREVSL